MSDAPPVTVVDPSRDDGPGDLLAAGSDHEGRRLPRRVVVLSAVVLLIAAVAVTAVRAELSEREQQRVADEAIALADRVHLRARLDGFFAFEVGTPRLQAVVALDPVGGSYQGPRDRVDSVSVEGESLSSEGLLAPLQEGVVQGELNVDCGAVAAGRLPTTATVVVIVVPASGVPHPQRLPIDPVVLRQAVLEACDLPDPAATTLIEAAAQDDALLLFVEAVVRSNPLLVEEVTAPGFELLPDRFALPYRISPGGGALRLRVRLVDCAAAHEGERQLQVRLADGADPVTRQADALISQPQPGSRPAAELLQRLIDEGC